MLRVREIRERRGLTQRALSIAADLDVGTVHRIEKGKHNPTISVAVRLAEALGVSLDELVVLDDEPPTTPEPPAPRNGNGSPAVSAT